MGLALKCMGRKVEVDEEDLKKILEIVERLEKTISKLKAS